jgi:hypothetical protein
MSDRRERRFTLDLPSGRILDGSPEPPVREIPDEEWRPIGRLDSPTGPMVDYSLAHRWRPLSEFLSRR